MLAFLLAITLAVTPRIAQAPSDVRIVVRVPSTASARLLVVELSGEEGYMRSDIPMDGEASPITHRINWRDVRAGDYEVTARVFDTQAKLIASASSTIHLEGRF